MRNLSLTGLTRMPHHTKEIKSFKGIDLRNSMKQYVVIIAFGVLLVGILGASLVPDQAADAGERKKLEFTETVTSSQDPGRGNADYQLAVILPPSEGTLYDGSVTFASSSDVQVFVLHELGPGDAKGQPTWTIDEKTVYGLSLMGVPSSAGSFEFTGAALALHSQDNKPFTATASIDGWAKGQAPEIILQRLEVNDESPFLLSKGVVPVIIPMHQGLHDAGNILYIITDASNQEFAEKISKQQDWRVELAPSLANAPKDFLQNVFIFTNGVRGDGLYGYQNEVFSGIPGEPGHAALNSVIEVTWKKGQNEIVLESAQDVLDAENGGRVEFNETGIVANISQIVWPDGQLTVRENPEITSDMEYGGGQVIEIDKDGMTVTFVAHRGWGPDGRTAYHIVTGATPSGPAGVMGVVHAPDLDGLVTSSAAADLFRFQNGIIGPGALGFQPGIAGAAVGDKNYTPMWRVYIVEWNEPGDANILETRYDIDSSKKEGLLTVSIASPMNNIHVVNSPVIDPFQ